MEKIKLCTQMPTENIPVHLELFSDNNKLWKPGTVIKVSFLDGEKSIQDKVIQYAKEWENYANIQFDFGDHKEDAQIRISFRGEGSWSKVGTDCLGVEDKSIATMNFGWFNQETTDDNYSATVLHEFGHALGFIHEHQSPLANIPWNRETIYKYYKEKYGWESAQVNRDVIEVYNQPMTNFSEFDPQSIMVYFIPKEITDGNFHTEWNTTLSDTDKVYANKWYPGGFKDRISNTFGYVKNSRLMATENRIEPQAGHVHWAIIHKISIAQKEIANDSQKTLDALDGVTKEQLDQIFGYMKNGRLMITTDNIEPHEGHVNWARGQTAEVVKQEIRNDAKIVMENEKFRVI
ncbi:M12 family metallopeptidase [Bacillus cereus group sp. MYBK227-2]|uniref:M12 family metallopeptidase n=1 Tax=Bacillus cereus group sp. MYBK227-2 TaxID=3450653 RepID=UPI003F7A4165